MKFYSQYVDFRLGDEDDEFRLYHGGVVGNSTADMARLDSGSRISTYDQDPDDRDIVNCGQFDGTGNWQGACLLIGLFDKPSRWGDKEDIAAVEMKMRPESR